MIKETMVAGEQFEIEFQVTLNNTPEDINGFTAKIELRETSSSGKLLGAWTDASAEITRNNSQGIVTLTIPAAVTNAYTFRTAYLDLLLINSITGRRSAELQITLDRGVTR